MKWNHFQVGCRQGVMILNYHLGNQKYKFLKISSLRSVSSIKEKKKLPRKLFLPQEENLREQSKKARESCPGLWGPLDNCTTLRKGQEVSTQEGGRAAGPQQPCCTSISPSDTVTQHCGCKCHSSKEHRTVSMEALWKMNPGPLH